MSRSGRPASDRLFDLLIWGSAGLIALVFAWLLSDLLSFGVDRVTWSFLTSAPLNAGRDGGIGPILLSTLIILCVALAAALPLGLGTAIWLTEYGLDDAQAARRIRITLDVLAGVPSIVFGLFGNALFCVWMGLGFSLLSGGLTLACMVLPILIRTTAAGLAEVPDDWRRGAAALGREIDTLALRRRVGMIFQRPNPFPLSIRRNLDMPLREHGVRSAHERAQLIESALRDVGLWDEVHDRLDAPALGLSGGQQQRLCIARALVLSPEVLLMDEPCSALDPISSAVVEDLIQRLRGRYTIVIVTHNLAQARRIANYAAFFWMTERVGKLIEFGQSRRVFDAPRHDLTAAYVSGARG